jgi:NADH-quinone oxidoreductase subunit L
MMTIPLLLLAIGAVASGWVGIAPLLGGGEHFAEFLAPVVGHAKGQGTHAEEWTVMIGSVILGFAGIAGAAFVYLRRSAIADTLSRRFSFIYQLLWNKYYVDEFYDYIIVKPAFWIAKNVIVGVTDGKIIEGIVNGVPGLIGRFSLWLRRLQTGMVHQYAAVMVIGAFVVIAMVLLW